MDGEKTAHEIMMQGIELAAFLVSDKASAITRVLLPVDDGFSAV